MPLPDRSSFLGSTTFRFDVATGSVRSWWFSPVFLALTALEDAHEKPVNASCLSGKTASFHQNNEADSTRFMPKWTDKGTK